MAAASAPDQAWAVCARVSPVPGQVLDLRHARMAEPFASHVHDAFSIGVCLEGLEVIRYRGCARPHPRFPEPVVMDPARSGSRAAPRQAWRPLVAFAALEMTVPGAA